MRGEAAIHEGHEGHEGRGEMIDLGVGGAGIAALGGTAPGGVGHGEADPIRIIQFLQAAMQIVAPGILPTLDIGEALAAVEPVVAPVLDAAPGLQADPTAHWIVEAGEGQAAGIAGAHLGEPPVDGIVGAAPDAVGGDRTPQG